MKHAARYGARILIYGFVIILALPTIYGYLSKNVNEDVIMRGDVTRNRSNDVSVIPTDVPTPALLFTSYSEPTIADTGTVMNKFSDAPTFGLIFPDSELNINTGTDTLAPLLGQEYKPPTIIDNGITAPRLMVENYESKNKLTVSGIGSNIPTDSPIFANAPRGLMDIDEMKNATISTSSMPTTKFTNKPTRKPKSRKQKKKKTKKPTNKPTRIPTNVPAKSPAMNNLSDIKDIGERRRVIRDMRRRKNFVKEIRKRVPGKKNRRNKLP